MSNPVRLVITGSDSSGNGTVLFDGTPASSSAVKTTQGAHNTLWGFDSLPHLPSEGKSPSWVGTFPPRGGARFLVMRFRGQAEPSSGQLAAETRNDPPGLHQSKSIDFISVLEGTVILYLDHGKTLELAQGSTLVQVGARHTWKAKGPEDAVLAFVILGC